MILPCHLSPFLSGCVCLSDCVYVCLCLCVRVWFGLRVCVPVLCVYAFLFGHAIMIAFVCSNSLALIYSIDKTVAVVVMISLDLE